MIPRVWGDDGSHNPLRCKMTPESASLVCCYAPRTRSHETAETAFLRLTELPRADETMLLLMLGGESVEMPEMLALQQLGCLREMMLREAQLLDSLSHHCVVPLEGGWLEQRTTGAKFFREHTCGASGGNGKRSSGREKGLDISTQKTAPCLGHQPAWCDSQKLCCGNAVDYFLRSCVPLTVSAEDGDTGEDSTFGRSWIDSPDGSSVHEDVLRQSQLPWGGDGNTDWRGTAEPKGANRAEFSAVDAVVSSTTPALPSSSLKRCGCTGAPHRQWNDQRSIRLTSYLLLPDWLPLRLWFEREFEPRVASDGNGGVRGIDAAVTASEDWASVWRQLSVMFLQVVSGVEFLHERGVVHNNLHLESVWVGTDGKCRVGNVSQATPPGFCRPPPKTEASWHFASPERRRGCKVDSHSDVYSLGVLMLEFWRRYELSREGRRDRTRTGSEGIVDTAVMSRPSGVGLEEESAPTDGGRCELLDLALVKRMLADDPFDRPDCFEIVDALSDDIQRSSSRSRS